MYFSMSNKDIKTRYLIKTHKNCDNLQYNCNFRRKKCPQTKKILKTDQIDAIYEDHRPSLFLEFNSIHEALIQICRNLWEL